MSWFDFSGQWIASNTNKFPQFVMDLDRTPEGSKGRAYAISQNASLPSAVCNIALKTNKKQFSQTVFLEPFDAFHGQVLTARQVKEFFPDSSLPDRFDLQFERTSRDEIRLSLNGPPESASPIILTRSRPPKYSDVKAESGVNSWESFRKEVSTFAFREFIFRGQQEPFSLQTSFHRTNRKDLVRYLSEDVQQLHHSIAGSVKHVFNLAIPQDLGAMLSLAQHHGFPTPLLDWSYSPFVAAWFAFSKVSKQRMRKATDGDVVRIYCLHRSELIKFQQFLKLTFTLPHTSLLDALPIENNRAVPQQGVLMSTNIQDVEAHLYNLGQAQKVALLKAYDIPVGEADRAMNELAMMGITRSTLMPGIDSICADLRRSLFG